MPLPWAPHPCLQLPASYRCVTFEEATGKSVLVDRLDKGELQLL